ncbi:hypothetical protein K4749_38720 [Streptomyces sp. TRM72054]|uniref:hypothetical protein n=1 Tax=Streptomyces sp. TRM72054 TaxID=2870562 RepID=UPI001C8B204E|nr:hypothetical protein [Streptomyces sp. TRM72054]MBX9399331.1 hypothetical protein [Streptomyces sp. TRM72054]
MSYESNESELDAARVVSYVTGRRIEPYDECGECGDFHDRSFPTNGRYDFHHGEDGALEVTLATSSVAERNERGWNAYRTPQPAPGLRARWHVTVDSTAKAKAPRGRKGARGSGEFLKSVGPALAELERRGVSALSAGIACFSDPVHDPACPYGALRRAGVQFAMAEPDADETGSIRVSVLFAYDDMPTVDERHERKKEAEQQRKQQVQAGRKPIAEEATPDPSFLGPVLWSVSPSFVAQLESRRRDDEQKEAEILRVLADRRLSESQIAARARKIVDERITLARTMTWRVQLPSQPGPGPKTANAGTNLIDLLEVEFSFHPDLATKLRKADPHRTRREVFFWLTWARSSAWHRLTRHGLVPPDRAPKLPAGVTGVWVGYLADHTQVLHWDTEAGWTCHLLTGTLPSSICQR